MNTHSKKNTYYQKCHFKKTETYKKSKKEILINILKVYVKIPKYTQLTYLEICKNQ